MQKKLTVSQLNSFICGVFEDEYVLHDITVEGEISEISLSGGRTYFTLKENDCQISCVCFSAVSGVLTGMSVEASGSVGFYKRTGRLSFVAKQILPKGEGLQYMELMKLKAKLAAEGLFENRPPLPANIRKVAVLTSESGAVIHDIISVVRAKDMLLDIAVYDVRVQGAGSAEGISDAVKMLNAQPCGVDVIIIARGGGGAADLQSYNTERVARAVAGSRLPIISAVGHETDYTLCDLCASARAGTPSIAADMVASPVKANLERVASLVSLMLRQLSRKYAGAQSRINYGAARLIGKTELIVSKRRDHVSALCRGMYLSLADKVLTGGDRTRNLAAVLDRLSPLKILARGYSKVLMDGKEIGSADRLHTGDNVEILFKDGKKSAEIK